MPLLENIPHRVISPKVRVVGDGNAHLCSVPSNITPPFGGTLFAKISPGQFRAAMLPLNAPVRFGAGPLVSAKMFQQRMDMDLPGLIEDLATLVEDGEGDEETRIRAIVNEARRVVAKHNPETYFGEVLVKQFEEIAERPYPENDYLGQTNRPYPVNPLTNSILPAIRGIVSVEWTEHFVPLVRMLQRQVDENLSKYGQNGLVPERYSAMRLQGEAMKKVLNTAENEYSNIHWNEWVFNRLLCQPIDALLEAAAPSKSAAANNSGEKSQGASSTGNGLGFLQASTGFEMPVEFDPTRPDEDELTDEKDAKRRSPSITELTKKRLTRHLHESLGDYMLRLLDELPVPQLANPREKLSQVFQHDMEGIELSPTLAKPILRIMLESPDNYIVRRSAGCLCDYLNGNPARLNELETWILEDDTLSDLAERRLKFLLKEEAEREKSDKPASHAKSMLFLKEHSLTPLLSILMLTEPNRMEVKHLVQGELASEFATDSPNRRLRAAYILGQEHYHVLNQDQKAWVEEDLLSAWGKYLDGDIMNWSKRLGCHLPEVSEVLCGHLSEAVFDQLLFALHNQLTPETDRLKIFQVLCKKHSSNVSTFRLHPENKDSRTEKAYLEAVRFFLTKPVSTRDYLYVIQAVYEDACGQAIDEGKKVLPWCNTPSPELLAPHLLTLVPQLEKLEALQGKEPADLEVPNNPVFYGRPFSSEKLADMVKDIKAVKEYFKPLLGPVL